MAKKKEQDHGYDDGSYVIKKNRKFSIVAFILCMLVAFVIWLYAENKENQKDTEMNETGGDSLYTETCTDVPSDTVL